MTVIQIDQRFCLRCGESYEFCGSWLCEPCLDWLEQPFVFEEKAPAKSSASALACGACQGCGCPLDGRPRNPECDCPCHK